ncbi:prephenate dehydrogenase [Mobilicoccus pelagius]|uniref:Prephenate dehydrogenase n=1 Tax=Mobilicoccus pelagius NBRC 104925 TaxID=1089455 RepID=H5UPE3_9MICO|nr:prephenate dehydrogenase [Mobilicoccus pelagius]GAB47601.1 putative prephenate dehydrogenase [Mobilicoccus pelagius NBRC 104925]
MSVPREAGRGLGPVLVVGTGLIGTSLGLALRAEGVTVTLSDPSPTACALARDLGAGALETADDPEPAVVVVAAPPDVVGAVVAARLAAHPHAVVTDVASVKSAVLGDLLAAGVDVTRYVGSHPMAGRERSGAIAGRADLFQGRPWVVVPHEHSDPAAVEAVTVLATAAGGAPVRMPAHEHDEAVAAVSHVPQVAASLVAARLRDLSTDAVGLAGQGVRDVTRIAASDPALWTQILVGNAAAVSTVLGELHTAIGEVLDALDGLREDADAEAPGARATLAAMLADGNAGHARIPGKHGSSPTMYTTVTVLIPDEPGMLARLFADVGDEGVNIEDIRMEHAVGRLVGVVDLLVRPDAADPLCAGLLARGWNLTE